MLRILLLGVVVVMLGGCATSRRIDWASRLGEYTRDEAILDLGPPDKTATLSDGRTIDEWLEREGATALLQFGTGSYLYGGPMMQQGLAYRAGPDWFLRLYFDESDRLVDWKQVSR